FGMPRPAGTHLLVGRILGSPSGIAHSRRVDSLELTKRGFDSPETARRERGLVEVVLRHVRTLRSPVRAETERAPREVDRRRATPSRGPLSASAPISDRWSYLTTS